MHKLRFEVEEWLRCGRCGLFSWRLEQRCRETMTGTPEKEAAATSHLWRGLVCLGQEFAFWDRLPSCKQQK